MSHLVLRLGDLLHFHPFAPGLVVPKPTRNQGASVMTVEPRSATLPDDLTIFSLSIEHKVKDRRADLDRLGLIGLGDADSPLQEID